MSESNKKTFIWSGINAPADKESLWLRNIALGGKKVLVIYKYDSSTNGWTSTGEGFFEPIDVNGFVPIKYRDEYVSGSWVAPAGVAAPDAITVTIMGVPYQMLSFDGATSEERISNQIELAHDIAYDEVNSGALKLEFHAHFMPSDNQAGTVKWFVDWVYIPPFGGPLYQDTISFKYDILANKQHWQYLAGVELPVPTGGYELGGMILFSIRRTPTDIEDTYPSDILFLKAAMHVPTNGDGSRERYQK